MQSELPSGMDEEAAAAMERARRDPRKRTGAEWVERESRGGLSWRELHEVNRAVALSRYALAHRAWLIQQKGPSSINVAACSPNLATRLADPVNAAACPC